MYIGIYAQLLLLIRNFNSCAALRPDPKPFILRICILKSHSKTSIVYTVCIHICTARTCALEWQHWCNASDKSRNKKHAFHSPPPFKVLKSNGRNDFAGQFGCSVISKGCVNRSYSGKSSEHFRLQKKWNFAVM